jgi:hypothetical protein
MLKSLVARIAGKVYQKYPGCFPVNPIVQIFNKQYGHQLSQKTGLPVDLMGKPLPWFTYPAIYYLEQLDFTKKDFFEWGSGHSSKYFAVRSKSITSIEASEEWYNKGRLSLLPNQVLLLKTGNDYINAIKVVNQKFDVIIIDGILRDGCAEIAPEYLKHGGMIIYDNSERDPLVCKSIRDKGFIQIDFHGFGPINNYTWTTSLFFKEFNFDPIGIQPVIPKGGGF